MIAIGTGISPSFAGQAAGDSTPGGATDVWLWEAGIGLLWEAGIYMKTE